MENENAVVNLNASGSILDQDDIPNENQSVKCFSCGAEMTGVFCAQCGQKNDDYRRSILKLTAELIGSFTALESRIWHTWIALLIKPGKVAREFADGKRTKWSSPVRVFLAISIILFGFLSLTQTQLVSIDFNVMPKKGIEKPLAELTADDLRMESKIRFFMTQKQIDAQNKTRNFDLIKKWINSGPAFVINLGDEDTNLGDEDTASSAPTPSDSPNTDENIETLNPKDAQKIRDWFMNVILNPSLINSTIYKWLPRIMFLMMPITMFIAILFIRGRGNALLYDHLVHAAYIHSVAFFLLFVGVLLMRVMPGNLVAKILSLFMLIYLPLSLKRMFGRGWFKTVWTSYGVGFIYFMILVILTAFIIGWQISKFV